MLSVPAEMDDGTEDVYAEIGPVKVKLVECNLADMFDLELSKVEIVDGAGMFNETVKPGMKCDHEGKTVTSHAKEETVKNDSNIVAKHSENDPTSAYCCGVCFHRSSLKHDMISHMSKHRRHVCVICGLVLSSKNELELHLPIHKKEVEHVCEHCKHGFFRLSAYENHKCLKRPLLCHYCNEVFRFKTHLKMHIRQCHLNEKPKKRYCHHCEFSCWSGTGLNDHLRTHVGNKTLHCPHCSFAFSKLESLKNHMIIHRNEQTHTCPYCGSVFAKYGIAKIHMELHKDRDLFSCSKCSFKTHTKVNLKVHSFRQHNLKKHQCPHCNYETGAAYRLRTHLLKHQDQNAKIHACLICDYKTKYSWDLNRHVITHSKELPYICPHCDNKFSSLEMLKNHATRHSETLPLPDFLKL